MEPMAANVYELSRSGVLSEVATILQILVDRSNDERRRCQQRQSAGTITGPTREGTSSGSHPPVLGQCESVTVNGRQPNGDATTKQKCPS